MLAILWLIVWATVAEAYYNDYNWYTSEDGVNSKRAFDSQRLVHGNFSDSLRRFANAYNPAREGDEELTMAKVKTRLRMLKIFKHTGSSKDFDPKKGTSLPLQEGAKYCTMGTHTKVNCNHCTCVAGQLYMCTGMMCAKPPEKPQDPEACVEGKKRKVDACNYCYCRHGHEICSTKDCKLKHVKLLLRTPYTCHEGVRRKKDCNRCRCLHGEEYCTLKLCRKIKNLPNPSKVKTPNKKVKPVPLPLTTVLKDHEMTDTLSGRCSLGQLIEIDCRVCKCKRNQWRCSKPIYCASTKKPDKVRETCREETSRKIDNCNTCYCRMGHEFCEMKDCNEDEELQINGFLRSDVKQCDEGSYYRVDSCNYCLCLNGTEMCTRKPCLELENLPSSKCKEGSARQIDPCNYCTCKDGIYVCTNNICKERFYNALKTEKCQSWDVKYDKCNRCECHSNRWICTQKLCDGNGGKESEQMTGGLKNNNNYKVNAAESSSENTEKLEDAAIMRTNENGALRFKLAPKQCNKKQEKYRIDWCNWCYCNDYYQRVCTDWNCKDHGGKPPRPERKKCIEGARYQRGKCKYCYCNVGSVMICNIRRDCNETWWFLKHGNTKYQSQTTYIPPSTTHIVKRRKVAMTTPSTVNATESFKDIPNIQNDEVMETINNTEFMPQKAALRFEIAPKICIRGEEKYRIDWCNWCYCNDYFQRVCTDWKCNDHGGLPPPPEKRKCIVGARYERGKCKYCYCNVGSVMICNVRLNCTEPWWYLVHGTTPYRPQTPYSYPPTTTTTYRPYKVPKHMKKSKRQHHHDDYLRNGEKQCIEGSSYKVDSCNYCSCLRGNEICTSKICPNNDSEMEDVVKTSLENIDNDEILGSSNEDTEPRLFFVPGTSKWRAQTLPPSNEMATLHGQVNLQPTTEESQELTTVKPNTMEILKTCYFFKGDERQCIEGCYYKVDSCNYCFCVNGKEMCTNDPCISNDLGTDPDNNMVQLPESTVNDESSFPKRYESTENIESDENIDLSYIDNEYEKDGRREFHPAPKICNKKERYRIDWCNYCYCNDKHKRVCTNNNCTGHGSAQPPRELKKCIVGARFERSKCKYCYCGIYYHLICNTRPDCIEDQPEVQMKDTRKSLTNVLRSNLNIECEQASIVQIGNCNYCLCTDEGKWKCTDNICPSKHGPPLEALRMLHQNNHNDQTDKCNIGETYRLDACNYCYCTANRERVCTTNKCKHNEKVEGRFPLSSEENDCKIGTRFRQGKCNYCYCNYDHKLICSVNRCFRRSRNSYQSTLHSECEVGSIQLIDDCNYCRCIYRRKWKCTENVCPSNSDDRTFLRAKVKKPCTGGRRRSINACNYCVCHSGVEFCTQKACWKPRRSMIFSEPECLVGEPVPAPDSCNLCICLNSDILCTNNPCIQRQQLNSYQSTLHSECEVGSIQLIDDCNYCRCIYRRKWKCTENVCPSNSDDRTFLRAKVKKPCTGGRRRSINACNYCVCHSGVEFCTQKACWKPRRSMIFSEPECLVGEPVPAPDSCNLCICLNSDILCTNNPCIQRQQLIKRSTEKCDEGTKFRLGDGCNFCICRGGQHHCTSRACLVPEDFPMPIEGCKEGEARPAKDRCNVCICMHRKMVCTNKPCARTRTALRRRYFIYEEQRKPRPCREGYKVVMTDGCNECVCSDGIEFCTAQACHDDKPLYDGKDCLEGEVTPVGDQCNTCVCINNKLHCSYKLDCLRTQLGDTESQLTYIRMQHIKKHRIEQDIKQKCTPGKTYYPDDFDPNCPNECICDKQDLLCTKRKCFDNWDQNTPFDWPLGRVEVSNRKPQLMTQKPCADYEPLPSDDVCNSCMCLNERKICTVVSCSDDIADGSDGSLMNLIKESNGLKAKKKKTFCEPFTFFSPDNNRFCRNCFCLYNGLALCLLNLCKYSKDIPHQNSPEELDEICTPGEIGYPTKCVTCICSETSKWICTREELALCQERDCDVKDEFHMGFAPYCAGCKCPVKEWFCSIQSESCNDYSNVTCPQGTFIHNPRQHCSICLCGGPEEGSNNMCFTESKCVRQVSSEIKQ